MTKENFLSLLDTLAKAWARRDYAAAAALFADDVAYVDPLRYSLSGRRELRSFFENDEGYEQVTTWHTVLFDESEQVGAAEYTYRGTHQYHGVVLVKVADGGITHWREYQHVDERSWTTFVGPTAF